MSDETLRIAVLIDSDNVSADHVGNVLDELARYGTTSVRRMYGDWTSGRLAKWKTAANEHSIQPIQQFAYTTGKNATDSALIIDAMDLLHQNQLDAFALVSSDSDFTRLAARLRESGARVFGFGARTTPDPFINACDSFIYFDALQVDPEPTEEPTTATTMTTATTGAAGAPAKAGPKPPQRWTTNKLRGDTRLVNLLRSGIAANADDDGWTHLGGLGSTIQKQSPTFDSRNYGYAKLSDLIKAVGLFETRRTKAGNGGTHLQVRIPTKAAPATTKATTTTK